MYGLFARILAVGVIAPLGLAIVGAVPCVAQLGGDGPASIGSAAQRTLRGGQQSAAKPRIAPPPVLPGTKTSPEAAAPTQSPLDLTPTDALFDAINRGDIAAARDAVNRGADLSGQNILGLSPLELSVDLGRNDISFMLLSMREADASSRSTARSGGVPRDADQRDAILRASAASRAVSRSRVSALSARAPEEPVVAAPRLYSGNGGAPIPAAGFLGFDERRAVR